MFPGNVFVPPSSKNSANTAKESFDQRGCDLQKYKNKVERFAFGGLKLRVRTADNDGQVVGRYGGEIVNENGNRMVAILDSEELTTLSKENVRHKSTLGRG